MHERTCTDGDGGNHPLPRLNAERVAQICAFELASAEYDAERILVEEPVAPEPRLPSEALWPALRKNGYKTGREPAGWADDYTPPARLAEITGVSESTIRRLSTGATKTVGDETAIKLQLELDDEHARELEETLLVPWLDLRDHIDRQGLALEYLESMTRFAQQARQFMSLTTDERQALDDIIWISAAAQRNSFLGMTAPERLAETVQAFRATHHRKPVRRSRRLRVQSRRFLDHQAKLAATETRALHRGLHHSGTVISTQIYLTDDERVIFYDPARGDYFESDDPESDLAAGALDEGTYIEAMNSLGLKPVVDI